MNSHSVYGKEFSAQAAPESSESKLSDSRTKNNFGVGRRVRDPCIIMGKEKVYIKGCCGIIGMMNFYYTGR
jgi:hypothetical protein